MKKRIDGNIRSGTRETASMEDKINCQKVATTTKSETLVLDSSQHNQTKDKLMKNKIINNKKRGKVICKDKGTQKYKREGKKKR